MVTPRPSATQETAADGRIRHRRRADRALGAPLSRPVFQLGREFAAGAAAPGAQAPGGRPGGRRRGGPDHRCARRPLPQDRPGRRRGLCRRAGAGAAAARPVAAHDPRRARRQGGRRRGRRRGDRRAARGGRRIPTSPPQSPSPAAAGSGRFAAVPRARRTAPRRSAPSPAPASPATPPRRCLPAPTPTKPRRWCGEKARRMGGAKRYPSSGDDTMGFARLNPSYVVEITSSRARASAGRRRASRHRRGRRARR